MYDDIEQYYSRNRKEIANALKGKSLREAFEELWGPMHTIRIGDVVKKGVQFEYEKPECVEDTCIGCAALDAEVECADAIRYSRNIMKDMLMNRISCEELFRLNNERFGPRREKKRTHWKEILGEYITVYIKILNDRDALYKMDLSAQELHNGIEERLLFHGWVRPHFVDGKLCFYSNRPTDVVNELIDNATLALPPKQEALDFEPELDEDDIPTFQGERY